MGLSKLPEAHDGIHVRSKDCVELVDGEIQ